MKNKIRPTQNKIKQAIFNIFQREISDSDFLDIFAGTGQVGLEALNRGAQNVVLVENSPVILKVLSKKLQKLNFVNTIMVLEQDVFSAIPNLFQQEKRFDFIFADPPYEKGLCHKVLTELAKYDILKKSGFLILEHYWKEELSEETPFFVIKQKKRYGDTVLSIYRKLKS